MIDDRLRLRLLNEIERQPDRHLAARTAVNVAVLVAMRSLGPGATSVFLRDSADRIEHDYIARVLQ
jgi:hypothetical protein